MFLNQPITLNTYLQKKSKYKISKKINCNYKKISRAPPRKVKPHLPDSPPTYYRRGSQGGLNRAPVNPPQNMEFLRGIYAFMQVSRSSVSITKFQFFSYNKT